MLPLVLLGRPSVARDSRRSGRPRYSRGFTLIELMTVVVIVAVMATIAVPTVVDRLRERRSEEAAQRIAALYRGARTRAMGRGAAVLIHYTPDSGFTVFEAYRTGGCVNVPSTSCQDAAVDLTRNKLSQFNPVTRKEYEGLSIVATGAGSSAAAGELDVCFTPMGRAFQALNAATLAPMIGVARFQVKRTGSELTRVVTLLPNGISRLLVQ